MQQQDGSSNAQARSQEAYEVAGASILTLEVREQCQKHVAKLRSLLRDICRRPGLPPQIAD